MAVLPYPSPRNENRAMSENIETLRVAWLAAIASVAPHLGGLGDSLSNSLSEGVRPGPAGETQLLEIVAGAMRRAQPACAPNVARALEGRLRRSVYEYLLVVDAGSDEEQSAGTRTELRPAPPDVDRIDPRFRREPTLYLAPAPTPEPAVSTGQGEAAPDVGWIPPPDAFIEPPAEPERWVAPAPPQTITPPAITGVVETISPPNAPTPAPYPAPPPAPPPAPAPAAMAPPQGPPAAPLMAAAAPPPMVEPRSRPTISGGSGWSVRERTPSGRVQSEKLGAALTDVTRKIGEWIGRKKYGQAAAVIQQLCQDVGGQEAANLAVETGDLCLSRGKRMAATSCFVAALRADPVSEPALARLAELCIEDQQVDLAVAHLERLAQLARLRGDDTAALRAYRQIAGIAPHREDVLAMLVQARVAGQLDE